MSRIDDIMRAVCVKHEVTPAHIKGKWRVLDVVRARHEAMYQLRRLGLSYPRIGQLLGRHHTSVMHGVRKHVERNGLEVPR